MSHGDLHTAWCELLFAALRAAGLRDVVLSPGSRSTPLVLAAARTEGMKIHTVLDERSAGFFALGQARVTGRASVLLCTSGSAPAHYLPAVIEAAQSFVPMLVISADRPWEALGCASPQTIDQSALFGSYLRHRAELGEPDPAGLRAVGRMASQCALATLSPTPGPVQLNARFRKPLEPVDAQGTEAWRGDFEALRARSAPRTFPAVESVNPRAIEALTEMLRGSTRGVIACGPMGPGGADGLRGAVANLSRVTGFPVIAEATSQCRFGARCELISRSDVLLRDPAISETLRPELVIEVGAPMTQSAWENYLEQHSSAQRAVLAAHGWNDPRGDATHMVMGRPAEGLQSLANVLKIRGFKTNTLWRDLWRRAERAACEAVSEELSSGALSEGVIAHLVCEALGEGDGLMLGNSMPVRDVETYSKASEQAVVVLHQRGASGIDGLISGAAGAQRASEKPMLLLLGDLSFAHDLGGLNVASTVNGPLVVVVVQNAGGRIFAELPIKARAELGEIFERHFTTPQGLNIQSACAQFALGYERVESPSALRAELRRALGQRGCTVLEAVVPPEDGYARRRTLWRRTRERWELVR